MDRHNAIFGRRLVLGGIAAGLAGTLFGPALSAKGLGLSSILGKASDSALDKLAKPDAFYNDKDVRIRLPLVGSGGDGILGSLLDTGSKMGLLDGFTRKINNAAGVAAGEAKPIFRTAIDDLSFNDVPGIVSKKDGGTQYLRESSSDALHAKLEPLVDSALGDTGAYRQLDKLNKRYSWLRAAGIDRGGLNKTVTDQGLNGIFRYMGMEEANFRANPLGKAGKLLEGIF